MSANDLAAAGCAALLFDPVARLPRLPGALCEASRLAVDPATARTLAIEALQKLLLKKPRMVL